MLVTDKNFYEALEDLKKQRKFSLDTETTGLHPYKGHRLFSIICSTEYDTYYFNYHDYRDGTPFLNRDNLAHGFNVLLSDEEALVYLANAKFDMHMLLMDGVEFKARPWDVLSIAKTLNNSYMRYDLASIAKRAGFEKDKTVDEYFKKNKLQSYDQIPFSLMQPYGERDGQITFAIGEQQRLACLEVEEQTKKEGHPSFSRLIEREIETTKVCFEIEKVGMKIDEGFIKRATLDEQAKILRATSTFKEITGQDFVDSNKALRQAFGGVGLSGSTTKKGNPSFNKQALKAIAHPLSRLVEEYRSANKRVSSYYSSFLSHADSLGIVHPNIHQTGAKTFRFSVTDPALQTLEKPDEDIEERLDDQMRDAFRARDGYFLVAIDYKQQEYRLTADYAGETALIEKIVAGEDVHTATAALMGVSRGQAKTLNFMLLYGGGVAKLCMALMKPKGTELQLKALTKKYVYTSNFDLGEEGGEHSLKQKQHREQWAALQTVTPEILDHDLPLLVEAHKLQLKYFSSLPKTKNFIDRVQRKVRDNGFIYNWAGRRLYVSSPNFAYKSPNHLIQSSGAEIMRAALIELQKFLKPYKSKILLSIHDEVLLEMPKEEFCLIPEIRAIMKGVYTPFNGLYMDTDAKVGLSWGSMEKYTEV